MEYIDGLLSQAEPGMFELNKKKKMQLFLRDYPHMRTTFKTQHNFTRRVREYLTSLGYMPTDSPKDTKVNLVFEIKPAAKTAAA